MKTSKIYFLLIIFISIGAYSQVESKGRTPNFTAKDYALFGEKFTLKNVLEKNEMIKKYKSLKKGDTINVQFKSTIKSVCKKKGCWMKLILNNEEVSFVKFKDYGFFVPLNADSNEAVVNGKAFVEIVSVDELRHYAKDGGKSKEEIAKITKPEITYSFLASGVYIKK